MPAKSPPKKKPSVLKRARQSIKRNLRNRSAKTKVKTTSLKAVDAIGTGDAEKIRKALGEAFKTISSAASKGFLHKNTASRKISRLSKMANNAQKTKAA